MRKFSRFLANEGSRNNIADSRKCRETNYWQITRDIRLDSLKNPILQKFLTISVALPGESGMGPLEIGKNVVDITKVPPALVDKNGRDAKKIIMFSRLWLRLSNPHF